MLFLARRIVRLSLNNCESAKAVDDSIIYADTVLWGVLLAGLVLGVILGVILGALA